MGEGGAMPRTRTGRQDTAVVMAQGAWLATCPAMPRSRDPIAERRAKRRVRLEMVVLVVSQARRAQAA